MKHFFTPLIFFLTSILLLPLEAQIIDSVMPSNTISPNLTRFNYVLEAESTVDMDIIGARLDVTGSADVEIWYRPGGAIHSGASNPNVTTANGWILALADGSVQSSAIGFFPIIDNFSIPVQAGIPVGICFRARIRVTNAAGAQTRFSDPNGYLTIDFGTGKGFSGTVAQWPNLPTDAMGPVDFTFQINQACPNPPVAGSVKASDTTVCLFQTTNLSLAGAQFGVGQTHQWQSSPDGSTWTNMPGYTSPLASNIIITGDTYFRCVVSCSGSDNTSTPLMIEADGVSLSGTYTINSSSATNFPGGTNFASFADLTSAWSCGGVSGPVSINVQGGPYNESVVFSEVGGASESSPIVINGLGNTLTYSGTASADRTTLTLDGAKWITVDNLNIKAEGASFGWAVHLTNFSDHNTFRNCVFQTDSMSATANNQCAVVMSGSPTQPNTQSGNTGIPAGSYNTFEDNTFIGGFYSITVTGDQLRPGVGNTLKNNIFRNFYSRGVFVHSQDSLTIEGNDLSRPDRLPANVNPTGMYIQGNAAEPSVTNARIVSNRIHNFYGSDSLSTTNATGIHIQSATGTASDYNILANNVFYDFSHEGGITYLTIAGGSAFNQLGTSDHWKIYHNTFAVNDPTSVAAGSTFMIDITSPIAGSGIEIKNNLFYLDRGMLGESSFYQITEEGIGNVQFDYNAYYSPTADNNNVSFALYKEEISDFDDWQDVDNSSYDQNSVFAPIAFADAANGNYKPIIPNINNTGTDVTAFVSTDIENVSRSTSPDPGAWEFEAAPGTDLMLLSFTEPRGASCIGFQKIEVELANIGTDAVNSVSFEWTLNGSSQGTVGPISISLASGELTTVLIDSFNIASGGNYDISVTITTTGPGTDQDATNNTVAMEDIRPGISGTYTINQLAATSPSNFVSFSDFAETVNRYGICGPVTIDVVTGSGPYVEQVRFFDIPNADSVNTIILNGNGQEITYRALNSSARYTIALQGTRYMTIDNLIITAEGTTTSEFGWGIWASMGVSYDTIRNCVINSNTTETSQNYAGIVFSGSATSPLANGNTGFGNVIENNTIIGGSQSITLMSSAPGGGGGSLEAEVSRGGGGGIARFGENHIIRNNIISDFAGNGISAANHINLEISGNEIHRETRTVGLSAFNGIQLQNQILDSKIIKNTIRNSCTGLPSYTGSQRGISINNAGAADTARTLIANNMIYDLDGLGPISGIYMQGVNVNYLDIYHNTIAIEAPGVTPGGTVNTRGIEISVNNDTTTVDIRNNIITINRGGGNMTCIFTQFATYGGTFDYNGYYIEAPGNIAQLATTNYYSTLALWRATGANRDPNSFFAEPLYYDPANADYRPGTVGFDGVGDNLQSIVPDDFDNQPRPTSPDLGALEYDPIPCLGVVNVVIDSTTTTSIFLTWESLENEWEIEWGEIGFTPGSGLGTVVSPVNSKDQYELSGLGADTCVDIYIRELCGSDTSNWSSSIYVCTFYEYDVLPVSITAPVNYTCGDSVTEVSIVFEGNGFFPATNFDVGVKVISPIAQTVSMTYTDTLHYGERDTISVFINASQGGTYQLELFTDYNLDGNIDNDTLSSSVLMNDGGLLDIVSSHPVICGPTDVNLSAAPGIIGDFIWLDQATGDTLGRGESAELLNLNQTTTVLVRTVPGVPDQTIEPKDTTFGNVINASIAAAITQSMTLEVFSSTVLRTMKIYPASAGNLDLALRDSTGVIVNTAIINVPTGGSQPVTIPVGFALEPGKYTLGIRSQNSTITSLLYNSNGANYPYTLSGIVSITGSTSGGADYRYFYDMVFGSGSCPRPDTEYTIDREEPPVAQFSDDHLSSSADQNGFTVNFDASGSAEGTAFNWSFGDGDSATGETTTHTYTQNGVYVVSLIVSNGCGNDTISDTVNITGINVLSYDVASDLMIYPNPNNGRFSLSFTQVNADDMTIELLDISGKTISFELLKNHQGSFTREMDYGKLASGMYMLRLRNSKGQVTRKVLIQ